MNTNLTIAGAVAACLLGAAIPAEATDIRLVNMGGTLVHPFFRSNCFSSLPRNQWVFFGGVLNASQFTWTQFEDLIDPTCKKPFVELTYNIGNSMLPPVDNLPSNLVAHIKFAPNLGLVAVQVASASISAPDGHESDD